MPSLCCERINWRLDKLTYWNKLGRTTLADPNVTTGVGELGHVRIHPQFKLDWSSLCCKVGAAMLIRPQETLLNEPFCQVIAGVEEYCFHLGIWERKIMIQISQNTQTHSFFICDIYWPSEHHQQNIATRYYSTSFFYCKSLLCFIFKYLYDSW